MSVALILLFTCIFCIHSQDAAPNATFIHKGLIPNENSVFDEKAWDKKTKGPRLDKKPMGKKPANAKSGMSKLTSAVIDSQIVGGLKAKKGQFPWQVLIQMDDQFMCGGSLIDPEWVLTAAHCVFGFTDFKLTLGTLKVTDDGKSARVSFDSTEGISHEQYDDSLLKNDIALIKLPEPVDLTAAGDISTVRLPKKSEATKNLVASRCLISGWGKVGDDDDTSEELKYVRRKVVNNRICARLYGETISSSSLCIKNTDLQGTCQGDSGGPFVCLEKDKKYTQIGLVSFGSAISCVKYPSGFTRVSSYLGWISEKTNLAIR